MEDLMNMVSFGEDETKDTPEQRQARMKLRNVLEKMSDEALTELVAKLDFNQWKATFDSLHQEFLKAQCIVFQVSWGKDAIRESLNKAL